MYKCPAVLVLNGYGDAEASREKALPSQELMKSLKILEGKE